MMNEHVQDFDVVIVGAGLVGALLACALAHLPLKIAIIEAKPWQEKTTWQGKAIALNHASYQMLANLGLWSTISDVATPIQTIHISERGRFGMLELDAADLQLQALGYLVPEPFLLKSVETKLRTLPLTWFRPAQVQDWQEAQGQYVIKISDQDQEKTIRARLLIAADGAHSSIRKASGISAEFEDYQQSAMVCHVAVSKPQAFAAYERFTSLGTIAFLPLGEDRFALIITAKNEQIAYWQGLGPEQFLQALQTTFGYRLGRFLSATDRVIYPLQKVIAKEQSQAGVILLGNAAHAIHPIAAQGLNLSLQDVAALAELIEKYCLNNQLTHLVQVGSEYEAWRKPMQEKMIRMTDSIVSIFSHPSSLMKCLRPVGLSMLAYTPFLKNKFAKYACGLEGRLAKLMRRSS